MRPTLTALTVGLGLAMVVVPLPYRASAEETSPKIVDKTLVVWARPADYMQRGCGLLSIQDGPEFDAIVLGERIEQRWMAGSHNFQRTQSPADQANLEAETGQAGDAIRIAIVYRGRNIEIWRGNTLYTSYQAANQQPMRRTSDVYIGLRCVFGGRIHGQFHGRIDEARLYDIALTETQITGLKLGQIVTSESSASDSRQTTPKPYGCWTFDNGSLADRMGHFPNIQLIGSAIIEKDALQLDGDGYALVSDRREIAFRPPRDTDVQAGFFTPPHRPGQLWDTWLYYHEGVYYMYYLAGKGGRWDAHELAVSTDAVHWQYVKKIAGPRTGTKWMGTGHLWKSPDFDTSGRWVMNYSEWVGPKQDIMFATSTDLVNWQKVDESFRFVQDRRWYKEHGRWDCIDTIKNTDGGLYGYFTATPDASKVDYPHCGFGFARSKDGIRWEALPPVPGEMHGEFGGIEKIGNRYYVTISEGRIGVGDRPEGPFMKQKKNHNIFGGDVYFPRFFHGAPDGVLMNHFYRGGPVYAAPLKAVECDKEDGTLRLVWWRGNEALKAIPLPVRWERPSEAADVSANDNRPTVRWLANPIEMNQTTVLEATLQMPNGDDAFHSILFDQGDGNVEYIALEPSLTHFGHAPLRDLTTRKNKLSIDRAIDYGQQQQVRLLINRDMLEVYVNDNLTLMVRTRSTGRIGFVTTGEFKEVQLWRNAESVERLKLK